MLLHAHSGLRYLVLLLGIVVIVYAAWGLATKRDYDRTMRILAAAFTGTIDLTVLVGFANLLFGVGFYPQLGGHIVMMLVAAAVAHVVYGVMKRKPDEEKTFLPHIVGTLVVLGCVAAGIVAIGRPIIG